MSHNASHTGHSISNTMSHTQLTQCLAQYLTNISHNVSHNVFKHISHISQTHLTKCFTHISHISQFVTQFITHISQTSHTMFAHKLCRYSIQTPYWDPHLILPECLKIGVMAMSKYILNSSVHCRNTTLAPKNKQTNDDDDNVYFVSRQRQYVKSLPCLPSLGPLSLR